MKELTPCGHLEMLTGEWNKNKSNPLPSKERSKDEQLKEDYFILLAYQGRKKAGKDVSTLEAIVKEIENTRAVATEAAFWIEPDEMVDMEFNYNDVKDYLIRLTLDIAKDKIDSLMDSN